MVLATDVWLDTVCLRLSKIWVGRTLTLGHEAGNSIVLFTAIIMPTKSWNLLLNNYYNLETNSNSIPKTTRMNTPYIFEPDAALIQQVTTPRAHPHLTMIHHHHLPRQVRLPARQSCYLSTTTQTSKLPAKSSSPSTRLTLAGQRTENARKTPDRPEAPLPARQGCGTGTPRTAKAGPSGD